MYRNKQREVMYLMRMVLMLGENRYASPSLMLSPYHASATQTKPSIPVPPCCLVKRLDLNLDGSVARVGGDLKRLHGLPKGIGG